MVNPDNGRVAGYAPFAPLRQWIAAEQAARDADVPAGPRADDCAKLETFAHDHRRVQRDADEARRAMAERAALGLSADPIGGESRALELEVLFDRAAVSLAGCP